MKTELLTGPLKKGRKIFERRTTAFQMLEKFD
jgi:hypothetical protein